MDTVQQCRLLMQVRWQTGYSRYSQVYLLTLCYHWLIFIFLLPVHASEQGNVIGLVSMYIYVVKKNLLIERTSDLIYLKFVATDFSPKIISPSTGENSGDSA